MWTENEDEAARRCKRFVYHIVKNQDFMIIKHGDTLFEKCMRRAKVCGLFFLIVLSACLLAVQANSDHMERWRLDFREIWCAKLVQCFTFYQTPSCSDCSGLKLFHEEEEEEEEEVRNIQSPRDLHKRSGTKRAHARGWGGGSHLIAFVLDQFLQSSSDKEAFIFVKMSDVSSV